MDERNGGHGGDPAQAPVRRGHGWVLFLGLLLAATIGWGVSRSERGDGPPPLAGRPGPPGEEPSALEAAVAGQRITRPSAPALLGPLPIRSEGFVDLLVLGLPEALRELEAQVQRPHPERPQRHLPGPRVTLDVREGRAAGRVVVPAGERIHFVLSGRGVRAVTEREPLEVPEGAVRAFTVDLSALCTVRGRVVDVPGAGGRTVTLRYARRVGDVGVLPPHPIPMHLETRLDAGGEFVFGGVPRGTFVLELRTARGEVPLVEWPAGDPSQRAAWIACEAAWIEVRPNDPLVGLAPVDGRGDPLVGEPFAVIANAGTASDAFVHPNGIALVRLAEVADPIRLGLFLPRRGVYLRDPSAPAPVAGERLEIVVGEGNAPAGSIRVVSAGPLDGGLIVDFERHGPGGPERLLGLQVLHLRRGEGALRMERLPDGARLHGLPAGTYDLAWSWGGRRPFAQGVVVEVGGETLVEVDAPRLREIEIQVAEWDGIPEPLRPIEVWNEGVSAPIRAGRALLRVAEPVAREVWIRGRHDFWWPQPQRLLPEGEVYRLELSYGHFVQVPLDVEPLLGGRIVAEIDQDPRRAELVEGRGAPRWVQPQADGRPLLVFEPDDPPAGRVLEFGQGFKLLRGWFDLAAAAPVSVGTFSGHWCDVSFEAGGSFVEVYLEGPTRSDQAAARTKVATLDSSLPARIWVPDGARTLLARDPLGNEARVELTGAPALLEIDLWR